MKKILLIIVFAITLLKGYGQSKNVPIVVQHDTTTFKTYLPIHQLVVCSDSTMMYELTQAATGTMSLSTTTHVSIGSAKSGIPDTINYIATKHNVDTLSKHVYDSLKVHSISIEAFKADTAKMLHWKDTLSKISTKANDLVLRDTLINHNTEIQKNKDTLVIHNVEIQNNKDSIAALKNYEKWVQSGVKLTPKNLSDNVLVGDTTGVMARFPMSKMTVSNGTTTHSYISNIALVGETAGNGWRDVTGVGGVAATNGMYAAKGVCGVAKVGNSTDNGNAQGVQGRSIDAHTGGNNTAFYGLADNSTMRNFAFYGFKGVIFNNDTISTAKGYKFPDNSFQTTASHNKYALDTVVRTNDTTVTFQGTITNQTIIFQGYGNSTLVNANTIQANKNLRILADSTEMKYSIADSILYIGKRISTFNIPENKLQINGSASDYIAINLHNRNPNGSSDYVASGNLDNGTTGLGPYGTFGICNSKYLPNALDTFNYPNDVYLFASGGAGNLNLAAINSSSKIRFATGGASLNNRRVDISDTGLTCYSQRLPNIVLPFVPANWTVTGGFSVSNDTMYLTSYAGKSTIYSTVPMPITIGTSYAVTFTASNVTDSITWAFDGTSGGLVHAGVNYGTVIVTSTTNPEMTSNAGAKCKIYDCTIYPLVPNTGNLVAHGNVSIGQGIVTSNNKTILTSDGYGVATFAQIPILPSTTPTIANQAATKQYVDNLALSGYTYQSPISAGNLVGNTTTWVAPTVQSNSYILDLGGAASFNTHGYSFSDGDIVQDQSGGWVYIGHLAIGNRLGVQFLNSTTPIGVAAGYKNYILVCTNATVGSLAFTSLAPVNKWAVINDNSLAYHFGYSYGYSSASWSTISASTPYTASNGVQLVGTNFSPVYGTTASTVAQGNDTRITNGATAYGWGNWASNFGTTAGTIAQGNDTRITNGQTAYGWGNWATGLSNVTNYLQVRLQDSTVNINGYITPTALKNKGYLTSNGLPNVTNYLQVQVKDSTINPHGYITPTALKNKGYLTSNGLPNVTNYLQVQAKDSNATYTGNYITNKGLLAKGYITSNGLPNVTNYLQVQAKDSNATYSGNYITNKGLLAKGYITGGTISGVSLGSNLFSLTNGYGIQTLSYTGASATTVKVDSTALMPYNDTAKTRKNFIITSNFLKNQNYLSGVVPIGNGGTGTSSTPTADGVIYAASTSAYASTSAGTVGQDLTSNGAGVAPTFKSKAATMSTPADPTGTTSSTGVMMGLAGSITPSKTGMVKIEITGTEGNSSNTKTTITQIRYGTGTAPTNGAALTGTTAGASTTYILSSSAERSGLVNQAFISGLTVGTTYWIDLSVAAQSGPANTASVYGLTITAIEQ